MANMEAKELRIGNKLYNEGVVVNIDARTIFNIWDDIGMKKYSPIPITKEWLLNLGFKENDNIYKLNNFGKFIFFEHLNSFGFYPSGLLNSLMRMDNLKSVHQLQNLYFALTGKELEIDNG